jgi:hypothetical protein
MNRDLSDAMRSLPALDDPYWYYEHPEGVHVLSLESQAILKRAAERDAALQARHTKRGS